MTGGFQIGVLTCLSNPETQKNRVIASKVAVDCELKYNGGRRDDGGRHRFGHLFVAAILHHGLC